WFDDGIISEIDFSVILDGKIDLLIANTRVRTFLTQLHRKIFPNIVYHGVRIYSQRFGLYAASFNEVSDYVYLPVSMKNAAMSKQIAFEVLDQKYVLNFNNLVYLQIFFLKLILYSLKSRLYKN